MICLLPAPQLPLPLVSLSGDTQEDKEKDQLVDERGRRKWGRSQIIRQPESLRKSFSTLCPTGFLLSYDFGSAQPPACQCLKIQSVERLRERERERKKGAVNAVSVEGGEDLIRRRQKNSEPVFVNVYGTQESIPRNRFRQPM
jgi:hypothetical protein